ncbi:MAG: hypothetical protein AVO34_07620 [Firmicutes bacterium ML8_F2]|jgi:hypothetical protein|nr:MAG: hypothetical protein AVO34_07620 [Firmicutes bacterium ML8_F2]
MSNELPVAFPHSADTSSDYNPGIRLNGKRFIKEQTILEFAVEFLSVIFSEKWLNTNENDDSEVINEPFPPFELIKGLTDNNELIYYRPPIKMNLKLFSFFSLSPVDSRHPVHQDHFRKLVNTLENKLNSNDGNVLEKVELLEHLFHSFQGVGFNRTWCAQTFFPISTKFLVQETIWNESNAKRNQVNSWDEAINSNNYFNTRKHIFMARGGELLYLQLCNLFTTKQSKIDDFVKLMKLPAHESNIINLYNTLQQNLKLLESPYIKTFNRFIEFIDGLDVETQRSVNSNTGKLSCAWCPQECWKEAMLFAIELNRLMESVLDPVERIELLTTGCSLHVLRSICAQSVRYTNGIVDVSHGGLLGYAWLFTSANEVTRQQRLASQRNLKTITGILQKSLRNKSLIENAKSQTRIEIDKLLKEADNRYGHKLFLYLGKKLGIIAPFKGPGARFIMTDSLLRYLVLVLLRPGEKCEYEDFLFRLYQQYGIAVESDYLDEAIYWNCLPVNNFVKNENSSWFAQMLKAGGFLTELSDGCSLVQNDFKHKKTSLVDEVVK